ncbi:MAG: hypothetical protein SGPRY_003483 [Prymnesium sp.]
MSLARRPMQILAAAMRALLCALLSAALLLAWLMGSLSSQQPSETAWLEPSFCSTSDLNFNRYVSFVPGFDASDAADPGSLPPVDTEPALGYGCPADLVRSTPQDFVLPIDIGYGANVSFVIFRGEFDSAYVNLTLRDANGMLLLHEDVSVGPPSQPRSQWEMQLPPSPQPYVGEIGSRTLLFASRSAVSRVRWRHSAHAQSSG